MLSAFVFLRKLKKKTVAKTKHYDYTIVKRAMHNYPVPPLELE